MEIIKHINKNSNYQQNLDGINNLLVNGKIIMNNINHSKYIKFF